MSATYGSYFEGFAAEIVFWTVFLVLFGLLAYLESLAAYFAACGAGFVIYLFFFRKEIYKCAKCGHVEQHEIELPFD